MRKLLIDRLHYHANSPDGNLFSKSNTRWRGKKFEFKNKEYSFQEIYQKIEKDDNQFSDDEILDFYEKVVRQLSKQF